jgi:MinD-like ATPase involved in chromosome partitioning or flagellar assembly
MPDDKTKTGNPDRKLVSVTEAYEVNALVKKHELPRALVENVIKKEGPSRKKIEEYLQKMKKNRRS